MILEKQTTREKLANIEFQGKKRIQVEEVKFNVTFL